MTKNTSSSLGFGLGLRAEYYSIIENENPPIDWFEIMTEDYLIPGGRPLHHVKLIREKYPMVMHGVALSIGSTDPLDLDYVKRVKQLADELDIAWVSDHFCWTGVNQETSHDLLPLPCDEETLKHIIPRIKQIQDILQRPFLLENASTYLTFRNSTMTEWEFINETVSATGCKLLLDINNIYVSAYNHGFDPMTYLNAIPTDAVQQFHIAGHTNLGDLIVDTHDHGVIPDVWQLYEAGLKRFGMISTMIERDDRFPPFNMLLNELNKARNIAKKVL